MNNNSKLNVSKRLNGLQLVRFLCALGIIIFHFECHFPNQDLRFVINSFHVSPGGIFVYSFFVISGIVLYQKYKDNINLKKYIYKRWSSIFLLFYLLYLILYIRNWFVSGRFFWGPEKWKIIFSFLGIDGFVANHGIGTWYIIGEWFLGAIIILYIFFPVLLYLTNRFKCSWIIILILLIPCYHYAIDTDFLYKIGISVDRGTDFITAIFYFYLGMVLSKYKSFVLNNKIIPVVMLPAVVYFIFFNSFIPYSISILIIVVGVLLLFNLIGNVVYKNKFLCKIIDELSSLSYAMFLLQHVIILDIIQAFHPNSIRDYFIYLVLSIMLTLFFAKIFSVVEKSIKNSCLIRKLDNFFL